jgi:hypothetical protein
MAQLAEHVLGKDEVTRSNRVSSSIRTRLALKLSGFFVVLFNFLNRGFWGIGVYGKGSKKRQNKYKNQPVNVLLKFHSPSRQLSALSVNLHI